jgi:hypothetical protein
LKIKTIILLCSVILFTSCYDVNKPEKPKRFLTEREMTNIILDLSIMSAAKGIDKRKLEDLNILPQNYVFKKHNIDSTVFAENNTYYSYQLDVYNKIYQKVNDSLNALKKIAQEKSIIKLDKSSANKKASLKQLNDSVPNKKFGEVK